LSRIRWLFVIARNSSFTYKGQAVDVKRVAGELGVRYVLEGSVRKAGNRVRIAGQFIDACSGAHLWADHFDGSLEDIFELQDKVAISVAGAIEPALRDAEMQRSIQRPTADLSAYDLYLRARAELVPSDKEAVARGLHLLKQALGRDPGYGPALAHAAFCQMMLHLGGWTDEPEASRRDGVGLARRALRVAGDDPGILAYAAYVLGYFGEDLTAALAMLDRALEFNPSFAQGWRWSGWARLWAGRPDLAIQHFETAIRLNPRETRAVVHQGIGVAHFFLRQFEEARAMLLRSLQEKPGWVPTHRFLAACCAQMGRLDEAREVIKGLRNMTSVLIPSATHWRDPQHREFYLEGLRLAAGERTSPHRSSGTRD
jgi:adenylate cyclase